jgi:ribonuclease VapC
MVLDTSAVIAILLGEPEEDEFLERMDLAPRLYISAASVVESAAVLIRNDLSDVEHRLDPFLKRAGVVIVPLDEGQAAVARDAYRRYGRTRHKAALNLGDCFSYALAITLGEPLLFKGNDFGQTDVLVA